MTRNLLYSLLFIAVSMFFASSDAKSIQLACTNDGEFQATDEIEIDHLLYGILPEHDFNRTMIQTQCIAKIFLSFSICEDGGWSEICDNNFTKNDATIVCRQMGYSDIGVQIYIFPQYIGTVKMSRVYPVCSGHESNLNDCLVRHSDTSVQCSARRVGVLCFPKSIDPLTDLPLCGFPVPSDIRSTTEEVHSQPRDDRRRGDPITTKSQSVETTDCDETASKLSGSFIASNSISGLSLQKSGGLNLILVSLVVTFTMLHY